VLIVTDIYPAGEAPIPGVHARSLAEGIGARSGRDVRYVGDRTEAVEVVLRTARPGDLVLTLGAGDIGAVADQVRERLAQRETPTGDAAPSGEGDRHAG
jgi:UDP-N-acetylmuramate--alanine ligase